MAVAVEGMDTEQVNEIQGYIKEQLLAFPGVTLAMLHPRITQRYPHWRRVFDRLTIEELVVKKYDEVSGRQVARLYWDESREA
jgi:hypothetical protein